MNANRLPAFAGGTADYARVLASNQPSMSAAAVPQMPQAGTQSGLGLNVQINEAPGGDKAQVRQGRDSKGNLILIVDMLDRGIAKKGGASAVARAVRAPLRG